MTKFRTLTLMFTLILAGTGCAFHFNYVHKSQSQQKQIPKGKTIIWPIQAPRGYVSQRPQIARRLTQDLKRGLQKQGFTIIQTKLPQTRIVRKQVDPHNPFHWFFKNESAQKTTTQYKILLQDAQYLLQPIILDYHQGYDLSHDWLVLDLDIYKAQEKTLYSSIRLKGFYKSIIEKLPQALDPNRQEVL